MSELLPISIQTTATATNNRSTSNQADNATSESESFSSALNRRLEQRAAEAKNHASPSQATEQKSADDTDSVTEVSPQEDAEHSEIASMLQQLTTQQANGNGKTQDKDSIAANNGKDKKVATATSLQTLKAQAEQPLEAHMEIDTQNEKLLTEKATFNSSTSLSSASSNALTGLGAPGPLSASTSTATPGSLTTSVNTPVNHPDWGNEFSQKITWISSQRLQSAELQLNPANLGPVKVSLQINDDQASIAFSSPHSNIREVIEASLPRLREAMAESGITLGNTTVSDQSAQQQQQQNFQPSHPAGNPPSNGVNPDSSETLAVVAQQRILSTHNGVVDTFV